MPNQTRRIFTLGLVALCFAGCRQGELDAGQSTYSGTCEYWNDGEWLETACFTTVEVEDGKILWQPYLRFSTNPNGLFPPKSNFLSCASPGFDSSLGYWFPLELDWGRQKFECTYTLQDENGEVRWYIDDWGKVILSGNKLEGQVRVCYSGDDAPEDFRGRFDLVLEE